MYKQNEHWFVSLAIRPLACTKNLYRKKTLRPKTFSQDLQYFKNVTMSSWSPSQHILGHRKVV